MQSSTPVLGVTEKVQDIGSSAGLGTTRDFEAKTIPQPLVLSMDIHLVRAVVRQGNIFCFSKRRNLDQGELLPIKLQLRGGNFVG